MGFKVLPHAQDLGSDWQSQGRTLAPSPSLLHPCVDPEGICHGSTTLGDLGMERHCCHLGTRGHKAYPGRQQDTAGSIALPLVLETTFP